MALVLADRIDRIKPSATIAVSMKAAELRAEGKDIISLGTGEPDFDTPDHIKAAAKRAIDDGRTKYTAVDGTSELKQAIVEKYERDNGLRFGHREIIVSNGAKQSIFNLMTALLNEGDEVIIPAPYWVSYPDMATLAGGRPVIVATSPAGEFKMTAQQLAETITPKTRLLILNSPSNPTGQVYREQELQELAAVLESHPRVVVVSDDIYEHIHWGGAPLKNLLQIAPQLRDQAILVNGVSKAYAMTGWRIGYAAAPAGVVAAMRKVQGQTTSNPCSISQAAATAALAGPQDCVVAMTRTFRERHDYVIDALNDMPRVRCLPADGAFYAFPDFSEVIAHRHDADDDVELAEAILEEAGVALVPGTAFGMPGYLRLSYATSMNQLRLALKRLRTFLEKID